MPESTPVTIRPAPREPHPTSPAGPPALASGPPAAEPAPGRRVVGGIVAAAVVGALALPVARVGIGWLIGLIAVGAAAAVARADRRSTMVGRAAGADRATGVDRAWRIAAAVAATGLVAVAGIRAAPWLVAICVLAGILLGSYALLGGRSWLWLGRGAFALMPAAVLGLGWVSTPGQPGARTSAGSGENAGEAKEGAGQSSPGRILLGIGVGAVLLLVFGALFRSADPAFAALTADWVRAVSWATLVRAAIGLVLVGVAALGATYLATTARRTEPDPVVRRRHLGLAEWALPLAMLDALFGLFVWVQFRVLFAGKDFVLANGGPDYADFARGGSAQLAVVTALTLGVLAVLGRYAGRALRLELGLLRGLGGVLCGLTLVVVASALTRLALYAGAYGLTAPRLLAFAAEVWLGLVVVLVLAAGIRLRAPWLPRATAAAAVAVLFALVAVNPDALIARTVLSRHGGPFPVDYWYLGTLSADAIDELEQIPDADRRCRPELDLPELAEPDPWYALNVSREHARAMVAHRPMNLYRCD